MSTHLGKDNLQMSLQQCRKQFAENHPVHNLRNTYLHREPLAMLLPVAAAAIYIHQWELQRMEVL
jgi:hypothetical protein